jgi:hypothetical protein
VVQGPFQGVSKFVAMTINKLSYFQDYDIGFLSQQRLIVALLRK